MEEQNTQNDEPRALIDYKNWRIRNTFGAITKACKPGSVTKLATRAGIPCFVVVYQGEPEYPAWTYVVYPTNDFAKQVLVEPTHMNDLEFRQFLAVFQGA
jgi:hypothetical protein